MATKKTPVTDDRPRCWLMKSEPTTYSWAQLVKEGRTRWDGVRNFEARNNLRAMKKGDLVLFYHSNAGKEVVGVARVYREAYPDPTSPGEDWSVVDIEPFSALKKAVPLATMKATPSLAKMDVVVKARISVTRVTPEELQTVLGLAETKLSDQPSR